MNKLAFAAFLISFLVIASCNLNSSKTVEGVNTNIQLIDTSGTTIATRFLVPEGYARKSQDSSSFGFFLRNLSLKRDGSAVHLYNGELKGNQSAHVAVIDMSVGKRDLQQCADAVMRLRGEYLFHSNRFSDIHFRFVSGFNCEYSKWREGNRVALNGNSVSWQKSASADKSYGGFLKYMETVFNYASTLSLDKELRSVKLEDVEIGDVLIRGGSPGHAVIVVDMIENTDGEKLVLLAQSYMPAQEIQVLMNPMNATLSPWYNLKERMKIYTAEYTFEAFQLKRF
ncbi:DUF4846 domain-containing protein [Fluviicola taffensis]|uniref:Lipoprotein n=1 Tax=Fluviicola taffensis (strain DSM 16823 / NCIMB 13979 / RW262) TaxID=755732 RepID=F2IFN9_FLUTR|nr:DUF4846 domain-containing protein [Fluviicola taffensis]AEA42497.1 hypothetical protein Fluta_0492 [Fluviicola taffensis DSM 16823]